MFHFQTLLNVLKGPNSMEGVRDEANSKVTNDRFDKCPQGMLRTYLSSYMCHNLCCGESSKLT